MASIQDINALKEHIYDTVQEYLQDADSYEKPTLHIFLDDNDMIHKAEIVNNHPVNNDEGYYLVTDYIRMQDNEQEPDIDEIDDLANSWIFLD